MEVFRITWPHRSDDPREACSSLMTPEMDFLSKGSNCDIKWKWV
jgi:hypothetical protein